MSNANALSRHAANYVTFSREIKQVNELIRQLMDKEVWSVEDLEEHQRLRRAHAEADRIRDDAEARLLIKLPLDKPVLFDNIGRTLTLRKKSRLTFIEIGPEGE